jgi:hypothetical protein
MQGAMSQPTRGGGSLSTQMGVIVHMITPVMSACGPCREKRPRLCAWAGRVSTVAGDMRLACHLWPAVPDCLYHLSFQFMA